jgi:predicted RNase H-like nuclease
MPTFETDREAARARFARSALAGVDGCPGGWVVAIEDRGSRALSLVVAPDFESVLALRPFWSAIAVDMPIGLPDRGPRACDLAARKLLGAGATSRVFSAPIRAVLYAASYAEACRRSRASHGKALSKQTFAILPKIREVDRALRTSPNAPVFEVHPELSFRALARSTRALSRKKSVGGRAERERLVREAFRTIDPEARPPRGARRDDVLDACAALWTARRIASGRALPVVRPPPCDSSGLPMTIWT